ncbi:hypothetical protein AX16_006011 [Volvariella volvacea WC 439]|nr:hypothetical protein AX16_006011 [Volvariella volvacea WC 439]
MSRPDVFVKYEENTPYFTYGGGQWSYSVDDRWSGRGQTWPAFVTNPERVLGNMTFTFNGTSVAIIGNTPSAPQSQSVRVSIDGAEFYTSSYDDPVPQSYRQWYQSPLLIDGQHTIVFEDIDGTSVDYALVTAGESTPLQAGDSRIMVDDDDSDHFMYVGDWSRDPGLFLGPMNGTPFRNATHRTQTVGDQIYFRFAGTSVSLYGVFIWPLLGSITANYTIDSAGSTEVTYTSSPDSSNAGLNQQPNFLLFQTDALTPGGHELIMTITDIKNQTFIFDYATYRPSFATVNDMPSLDPFSPPSSPTASSATSSVSGPSSSSTSSSTSTPDSSSTPVGPIVGGVVGGLTVIALGLIAWWLIRKRGRDGDRGSDGGHLPAPTPFAVTSNAMAEREPFVDFGTKIYQTHDGNPPPGWVGTSRPGLQTVQSQYTLSSSAGTAAVPPLSQTSGSPPTVTESSERQRTLSQRQAELRQQMQELENRIQQLNRATALTPSPSISLNHEAEILELRRQIEELRRENAMLATPPAYEERDQSPGAEGPSGGTAIPQIQSPDNDNAARYSGRPLPVPGKRPS